MIYMHTKTSQNRQNKMAIKVALPKVHRNFYSLFSCEKSAKLTSLLHVCYGQGFWWCFPKVILLPLNFCALKLHFFFSKLHNEFSLDRLWWVFWGAYFVYKFKILLQTRDILCQWLNTSWWLVPTLFSSSPSFKQFYHRWTLKLNCS